MTTTKKTVKSRAKKAVVAKARRVVKSKKTAKAAVKRGVKKITSKNPSDNAALQKLLQHIANTNPTIYGPGELPANLPNVEVTAETILSSNLDRVPSIKGFDKELRCRGFQFEIGQTYEQEGTIAACHNGFHACPADLHPFAVFNHYAPAGSRYARVTQAGALDPNTDKIASGKSTIEGEITLPEIVKSAVRYVFDRAKWKSAAVANGANEGALSQETNGAATASGDQGAACAPGWAGKVKGKEGCALFLVYRPAWNGPVEKVWAGIAGQDGIKPDVFYKLGADGKPVEVEAV